MKRLLYIANIRLPTEKAHGIQIMKTCEALARQGVDVELIVPNRKNHLAGDPFVFYSVEKNFKITKVWCLDLIALKVFGKLGFWIETWTFYQFVKKYVSRQSDTVYYTRDLAIAYWLSKKVSPVYYEIHTLPDTVSSKYKKAWAHSKGLITISDGLKAALIQQGVLEEKIMVARDAVDLAQFQIKESREECRRKLGLPLDQKIVVYTGHLYEWKGASIVAEAAGMLCAKYKDAIQVYLVGGTEEDVARFGKKYDYFNLHIDGWVEHSLMPYWHKAADILVLPTSAKTAIGARYTSPMKLFEYMLADQPIVASDIPSLREVLDESTATFFQPDDAGSLAEQIQVIVDNPKEAMEKAHRARVSVAQKFTWDNRAKVMKDFIFSHE